MAKTFEDNIARLEEIVTALEKGDAKLADSLKLFEEGNLIPPTMRTRKARANVPKQCSGYTTRGGSKT